MSVPFEWVPFEDRAKARVRRGPHVMTLRMKRLPWAYCARCGLLALKNDASRAALKRECVTLEDGS